MTTTFDDPERRLIPRWRDAATSIASGELFRTQAHVALSSATLSDLDDKISAWKRHPTLPFASDLLSAGFVLGRRVELTDAAEFVENEPLASESSKRIAELVLKSADGGPEPGSLGTDAQERAKGDIAQDRDQIQLLRRRSHAEPRNAMVWIDLARHYTTLGQDIKAEKAVTIALSLEPSDRFVLRSAARFFVHQKDADYAHKILRRNAATRGDPWLLSAEIAVASVAGRTSQFVRTARSLLRSESYSPRQITELAGSLASLELEAGKIKESRKLFAEALVAPNDNTVAQAEWASRRAPEIKVDPRMLETPRSFEARAWENFTGAHWQRALEETQRWFADEPFSGRPIMLGTHVAAVALEDYDTAIEMAQRWLAVKPDDQLVLNNLAFCLASCGRIEEAMAARKRYAPQSANELTQIAWTATSGLIEFRAGRVEEGRAHYADAIEMAKRNRSKSAEAMATAFWAREELLRGTRNGIELLGQAERTYRDYPDADAAVSMRLVLERLQRLIRERPLIGT